ncbi:MAG: hypothetical protein R8K21_00795 [Mariprofundales bacterium]
MAAEPKKDKGTMPQFELDLQDSSYSLTAGMSIPEIGRLEALTDAILMLFQNIEKQLNAYLVSCDEVEKSELHARMQRFLGKINGNRMIPLSFRLRVLRTFSKEARFLDADLTLAILNSYKITIQLVVEAARDREPYLLELGNLCSESISLAMQVARMELERYWEPSLQVVRQVHELTRVGLAALSKVRQGKKATTYQDRIRNGIVWYELMRTADFYQLTVEGQRLVHSSLEPYIQNVTPMYCPRQQSVLADTKRIYLISFVGGRQAKPQYTQGLRPISDKDRVILDITKLVPILKKQLAEVEGYMQGKVPENKDGKLGSKLRTEDEVRMTHTVTRHLLRCMHIIPRKHERRTGTAEEVKVVANIELAFRMPHKPSFNLKVSKSSRNDDDEQDTKASLWMVHDISPTGMGVETNQTTVVFPEVTNLVRLVWPDNKSVYPFWGQLRWRKHRLKGRNVMMGIQFLPRNLNMWWVQGVGTGSRDPVLGLRLKDPRRVVIWTNDSRMHDGSGLIINIQGNPYVCKVLSVIQQGGNFKACQVRVVRPFR